MEGRSKTLELQRKLLWAVCFETALFNSANICGTTFELKLAGVGGAGV